MLSFSAAYGVWWLQLISFELQRGGDSGKLITRWCGYHFRYSANRPLRTLPSGRRVQEAGNTQIFWRRVLHRHFSPSGPASHYESWIRHGERHPAAFSAFTSTQIHSVALRTCFKKLHIFAFPQVGESDLYS